MTSSHHSPYVLGYTHVTMHRNNGLLARESTPIPKNYAQFRLQSEIRLHEDGLTSNRRSACCGEYVLGSCTHRPSSRESWGHPKDLF